MPGEKLNPCPFCGNTIGLRVERVELEHPYFVVVHCSRPYGCGASGPFAMHGGRTPGELWNRRAKLVVEKPNTPQQSVPCLHVGDCPDVEERCYCQEDWCDCWERGTA